jgi:zinc/manganese transport system substrate-binding protein
MTTFHRAPLRLVLPFAMVGLAACAGSDRTTSTQTEPAVTTTTPELRATVVVTYSVLGRLVADLVGSAAEVVVIIPDGRDPHDYQPSARDMETLSDADLIVANGLGFEEYLEDSIGAAANAGTPIFTLSEHVTVRDANNGTNDGHGHGDDHDGAADDTHGAGDPHLWLSPATMLEALPALADAVAAAIGTDIDPTALTAQLEALDTDLAAQFDALVGCELVTGHDELGYFADRYGCEVIGAIVPSMTTTADASAKQLATLKDVMAEHDATTIFTSLGTPQNVAEQIARETGADVVELGTHALGVHASYAAFIQSIADAILDALR